MVRMPVVAGRFYPLHPTTLRETVAELIPRVESGRRRQALAVIAPHAGYVYSGAVAGEVFSQVAVPKHVIILGPNHQGRGRALALGTADWEMPMGLVPVDQELADLVLRHAPDIVADEEAHRHEHSLEVQVPFLQYLQPDLRIVPIVVSHLTFAQCRQAARGLAAAIQAFGRPVLLVASTDMTHYESRRNASRKDSLALERILALDPQGLYEYVVGNRVSMCGIMPTTITMLAAMELGAGKAELVCYTDSGAVSGDLEQVVGYAGLLLSG